MRADNTRFLAAAARQRAADTRQRAIQALRRLANSGHPVTFQAVARTAQVSRSWLYNQADLRAEIQRLRDQDRPASSSPSVPARQRTSHASLLRRLEAVNTEIRRLRTENQQLRDQLAHALGEHRAAHLHRPTSPSATRDATGG